jgi:hypothetical protein
LKEKLGKYTIFIKITLKQSDWQSYSRENFDVFGGIVIPLLSEVAIENFQKSSI